MAIATGPTKGKQGRIDARLFMKFLKKLQTEFLPNTTLGRIIEGEFLAVLKGSAKRTKRTTSNAAWVKYNPGSMNFKGWVKMDGKKYYCGPTKDGLKGFRYPDALWNRLQKRLKATRKRAETRVGLSKAVYYRVAADLKLRSYSSGWDAKLKQAYLESGGMGSAAKSGPIWGTRKVATTKKDLRGKNPKLSFNITSTNTFNPFTGGEGAVEASMRARGTLYDRAVTAGAFKSAKKLAGYYPNIKVKK